MRAIDVLSNTEYETYRKGWAHFSGKNRLEQKFNVHSSKPVVSQPYVTVSGDAIVGRVHVFQNRLRELKDPYEFADRYLNPFWHLTHYSLATEQAFHAVMNKARDNCRHVLKEVDYHVKLRASAFWSNSISVEVTTKRKTEKAGFAFVEDVNFTIIKQDRFPICQIETTAYANQRAYLREFDRLKQAPTAAERDEAREALIAKVNMRALQDERWIKDKRTNRKVQAREILEAIGNNTIAEEALFDYFSFWDIPKGVRMNRSESTSLQ